jgi:hypothetical protein
MFSIALQKIELMAISLCQLLQSSIDIVEGSGSINFRLALTQQIQIGAMQY